MLAAGADPRLKWNGITAVRLIENNRSWRLFLRWRRRAGSLVMVTHLVEEHGPATVLCGFRGLAVPLGADEFQFFRGQGPVDSALGFRHRLSFGRGFSVTPFASSTNAHFHNCRPTP